MGLSRMILGICLFAGAAVGNLALAQFPGMKLPGAPKNKDDARARRKQRADDGAQVNPPGVPVGADSPVFESFRLLGQQSVYHQRMKFTTSDPRMEQMMAQLGFSPAETITAGDTKQVSMHFKMPALGQVEDFELRGVLRNGRLAKKWISPGSGRILKEQDAQIMRQLAEYEAQAASSIARNLAMGPMGWVEAGLGAAGAAASVAGAAKVRKQAHEFFEWTCMDSGAAPSARREPPPLTDLRNLGEQTLDGVPVTSYEFYVHEDGRFHGPVQMSVAKDSGLPLRIGVSDARMGGGMQMEYFGFNQGGDFEVPACLGERQ